MKTILKIILTTILIKFHNIWITFEKILISYVMFYGRIWYVIFPKSDNIFEIWATKNSPISILTILTNQAILTNTRKVSDLQLLTIFFVGCLLTVRFATASGAPSMETIPFEQSIAFVVPAKLIIYKNKFYRMHV